MAIHSCGRSTLSCGRSTVLGGSPAPAGASAVTRTMAATQRHMATSRGSLNESGRIYIRPLHLECRREKGGAANLARLLHHQELLDLIGQRLKVVAGNLDVPWGRLQFSPAPLEDESLISCGVLLDPAALQEYPDRAVQVLGREAKRQRVGVIGHRRSCPSSGRSYARPRTVTDREEMTAA